MTIDLNSLLEFIIFYFYYVISLIMLCLNDQKSAPANILKMTMLTC